MSIARIFIFCSFASSFTSVGLSEDLNHPIEIGKYRQLFVDNHLIAEMQGVEQVLNQAQKHSLNPIVSPDRPWEGTRLLNPGVRYDQKQNIFTMDYQANWPTNTRVCRALSKDGIHWKKPDLAMVEYEGAKSNNIFRSPKREGPQGLHTPWDSDPQRQYKMFAGRHGPGMVSPDGINWTTPPESKKVANVASDSSVMVLYDHLRERYLGFTKTIAMSGGHDRRSYGITSSNDFLEWTPMRAILMPDARDDELARQRVAAARNRLTYDDGPEWYLSQIYFVKQIPYEGMYMALLMKFDLSGFPPELQEQKKRTVTAGGEDGIIYYELASSRDLEQWNRVGNRKVFLPIGDEAGDWDAAGHDLPQTPIIVGDEIRFYYGARKSLRGKDQTGAIGLATLRIDGWVSIDADEQGGTLTTKPLVFDGEKLVINVKAPNGSVTVEILDHSGNPYDGFGKADCDVFQGDSIRHTITWRGKSDVSQLAGKPLQLRFHLKNGKLYSFSCN